MKTKKKKAKQRERKTSSSIPKCNVIKKKKERKKEKHVAVSVISMAKKIKGLGRGAFKSQPSTDVWQFNKTFNESFLILCFVLESVIHTILSIKKFETQAVYLPEPTGMNSPVVSNMNFD